MRKSNYLFAFISMILAISLGALGAHKLKELLTPEQLDSFKTGVFYQIVHALAILCLIPLLNFMDKRNLKLVFTLMKIGPILFSGSIYLLSTATLTGLESIKPILGPITPIGGLLMIVAWAVLAYHISRANFKEEL